MSRECGDCSACCTGVLWFEDQSASGDTVIATSNMPTCNKYQNGCTIYGERPFTCRAFECNWKRDTGLPEFLKPNKCGFILYVDKSDGQEHTFLRQTKYEQVDQVALVWALWWATHNTTGTIQVNTQYNGELMFRGELEE